MASNPQQLFLFEGYGVDNPRVVFIGMEEASDDSLENLRRRLSFARRMDLREAHDQLFGPDWWERGVRHVPVWRTSAQLRAALDGLAVTDPAFDRAWRQVRDNTLGRRWPGADTLLTELLPVPTNRHGTWPEGYSELLGYSSLEEYRRDQLPRRRKLLHELFRSHPPEVVFCYGRGDWDEFKEVFDGIPKTRWSEVKSSPPSGAKPQAFQIATDGRTVVVLTNHFGGRGAHFSRQHIPAVVDAIRESQCEL